MDTIAAISTAQGVGGIGIVRISGENATNIADKVFKPFVGEDDSISSLKGYRAKYGKVMHRGEFIDDAVALVFRAPHSYTGENVVEISCHGGMFLTRRLLRAVMEAGAVLAKPGEFTKRAFLNGKMDLSQAEAVMDLISAKSNKANELAFHIREGAAGKKINKFKDELVEILANLSVWVDYPEDEDIPQTNQEMLKKSLEEIHCKIVDVIGNYDACRILKEGVKTVIIGRPNVGKSTLMNFLAGYSKSIVTDIPGTTRDIIEETVMIGDIPLVLLDTAGIRETDDVVEKIGVERAKENINFCDLTLLMLDASSPLSSEDDYLLNLCDKKRTIIVLNKCDLGNKVDLGKLSTFSKKIVELSALHGTGIEKFKNILEDMVGLSCVEPGEMMISNERQLNSLKTVLGLIKKALVDLERGITLDAVTVILQDAVEEFMEFTGENARETVINKVFSKFCVGK